MTKFENIVKRAVNFDSSRGDEVDIVNIPFETTKLEEEEAPVAEPDGSRFLKSTSLI